MFRKTQDMGNLREVAFFLVFATVVGQAFSECDSRCQQECIDVLNKYRENHDAPALTFSQALADKAQQWADGGKFGYDMTSRGQFGQLIEWDVKDEFPSFTSVIKNWHDKERFYDFKTGMSTNGKTLHDFTQVVWKRARKVGCGKGKMFGSKYYVVWMDADGVMSPNVAGGSENVGPPKREDIYWYEITKLWGVGKPLYRNVTKPRKEGNLTRSHILSASLSQKLARLTDDEDQDVIQDLNEVSKEQRVLNSENNIKQFVHDSLSQVFDQENQEVENLRNQFAENVNPYIDNAVQTGAKIADGGLGKAEESHARNGYMGVLNGGDRLPENGDQFGNEKGELANHAAPNDKVSYGGVELPENEFGKSEGFAGQEQLDTGASYGSLGRHEGRPYEGYPERHFDNRVTGFNEGIHEPIPPLNSGFNSRYEHQGARDREISSSFEEGEKQIENADTALIDNLANTLQQRPGSENRGNRLKTRPRPGQQDSSELPRPKGIDATKDFNKEMKQLPELRKVSLKVPVKTNEPEQGDSNKEVSIESKPHQDHKTDPGLPSREPSTDENMAQKEEDPMQQQQNDMPINDQMGHGPGRQTNHDELHGNQDSMNNELDGNRMPDHRIDNYGYPTSLHSQGNNQWLNHMGHTPVSGPSELGASFDPLTQALNENPIGLYDLRKYHNEPKLGEEHSAVHNGDKNVEKKTSSLQPVMDEQDISDYHGALKPIREPEPAEVAAGVLPLMDESPLREPDIRGEQRPPGYFNEEPDENVLYPFAEQYENGHIFRDEGPKGNRVNEESVSEEAGSAGDKGSKVESDNNKAPQEKLKEGKIISSPDNKPGSSMDATSQQPIKGDSQTEPTSGKDAILLVEPSKQAQSQEGKVQESEKERSHAESQVGSKEQGNLQTPLSPEGKQQTSLQQENQKPTVKAEQKPIREGSDNGIVGQAVQQATQSGSEKQSQQAQNEDSESSKQQSKSENEKSSGPESQGANSLQSQQGGHDITLDAGQPKAPAREQERTEGEVLQNGFSAGTRPKGKSSTFSVTLTLNEPEQEDSNSGKHEKATLPSASSDKTYKKPSKQAIQSEEQAMKQSEKVNTKASGEQISPGDKTINVPSKNKQETNDTSKKNASNSVLSSGNSELISPSDMKKQPSKPEIDDSKANGHMSGDSQSSSTSGKPSQQESQTELGQKIEKGDVEGEQTAASTDGEKSSQQKENPKDKEQLQKENTKTGGQETSGEQLSSSNEKPPPKTEGQEEKEQSDKKRPQTNGSQEEKGQPSEKNEEKPNIASEHSTPSSGDEKLSKQKESTAENEHQQKETSKVLGQEPESVGKQSKPQQQESEGENTKEGNSPQENSKTSGQGQSAGSVPSLTSTGSERKPEQQENQQESGKSGKQPTEGDAREQSPSQSGSKQPNSEELQSTHQNTPQSSSSSSTSNISGVDQQKQATQQESQTSVSPQTSGTDQSQSSPLEKEVAKQESQPNVSPQSGGKQESPANTSPVPPGVSGGGDPYTTSSVHVVNSPVVYQTDTTIMVGGQPHTQQSPERVEGDGSQQGTTAVNGSQQETTVNGVSQQETTSGVPSDGSSAVPTKVNENQGPGSEMKVSPLDQNQGPGKDASKANGESASKFGTGTPSNSEASQGNPDANQENITGKMTGKNGSESPGGEPKKEKNVSQAASNVDKEQKSSGSTSDSKNTNSSNGNKEKLLSQISTPKETLSDSTDKRPVLELPRPVDNRKPAETQDNSEVPNKSVSRLPKVVASEPNTANEEVAAPPTNPGDQLQHSATRKACVDNEERCSLWADQGHCKNVVYEDFMKQHCKSTCGYCALETEKPKELNDLFSEPTCKDAIKYQFSCPQWRVQGYCEKRSKEMSKFCRKTCKFCKKRKVSKAQKSAKLQDAKAPTSSGSVPSVVSNASPVSQTTAPPGVQGSAASQVGNANQATIAQAQSGTQTEGLHTAHAQAANAPNQATTAHAQSSLPQGAQIFAHASTGSGQGFAVAQAGVPNQKGFAVAQSANMPQQPRYASAQSGNDKHNSSAMAQSAQGHNSQVKIPTLPIANGFRALDERVMSDSPEYKASNDNDTPGRYFVETGDAEESNSEFAQPEIRMPDESVRKSNGKGSGSLLSNGKLTSLIVKGKPLSFDKGRVKEDDAERMNREENKVIKEFMERLNPEEPSTTGGVVKDKMNQEPKTTVSTKGCGSACQLECLNAINKYRSNHAARSLILDQTLANQAQRWANKRVFGHSPWAQEGKGGEVIAVGSFYTTFTAAIKAWHDEEKDFDWSSGKQDKDAEVVHFTQVIWRKARRLGCGKTTVNGEPYYIVQMDASSKHSAAKRNSIGRPQQPDLKWFMDSSPYWKDLHARGRIPRTITSKII
ncbi:uncharacterized protein LOC116619814 isoform X2 [Nematostella vectensis]|uniref:uncharacterized protein LOC116619814 isoform X2 n=1 Tax=Nematostella vectensis TaxID=45351 RepID=UPI0020771C24|nr:uncharacterized protein LOC116619814 isoform X2 [Nematostella vectensis]